MFARFLHWLKPDPRVESYSGWEERESSIYDDPYLASEIRDALNPPSDHLPSTMTGEG